MYTSALLNMQEIRDWNSRKLAIMLSYLDCRYISNEKGEHARSGQ
jgi:hypothetical protein